MAEGTRDPRPYELMTVFLPDQQDDAGQEQIDRVAGFITAAGGDITETLTDSPWGRRRLAYTFRYNGVDYRDGVYTLYHFQSAPTAIAALERELKLDTSTMRYLLVHDDPKTHEKPGPDLRVAAQAEETPQTNQQDATSRPGNPNASAPSGETLTDDAIAPEADPITVPAPEQANPETQVSVEAVADEGGGATDTTADDATSTDAAPAADEVPADAPSSDEVPVDTAIGSTDAASAADEAPADAPSGDEAPADTVDTDKE